ncbi:hypothetical protein KORDIASMS9_02082 [Kordia sp. SMS9]|uniref:hypothetical protein n=1 Tax=Kordia sp. SMS9 TaxID=2282170 RepID=UPI000E0D3D6D|nr:hypothetical protein [Kordia sp. SMS9]AXG69854.1 hypothetical protein KORDIASMS9_02082 [Kordia sp. SMS9]
MKNTSILLKIAAILWIIWGLVHVFAGGITMYFIISGDISSAISGIADAIDPSTVQMDYPAAAGAIIGQHGFNLCWVGLVTFLCAFFIWKGNKNAIFLAAITGGLTDLGYFIFLDIGGFVKFAPGTVMTIVSGAAIALSFYAYFRMKNNATPLESTQ